ncbi:MULTISPECIES: TRAP transporter substrate-binding protein [unclassified Marinobacter]|uniref:TRAP transporter substrate-binding protein n=1 Tax=unclassified Marinobacter TaxID=83889 RepID=UPI00200E6E85|nr:MULTISPECIES: TRAP transporter substrate-binding protein [unclassified Marinobacter]UQG56178.1 TRAP transporter substrate-binding protein [Marinobacter sp. M4C]UQG64982.1 TRAP transporter substrate-binding protein [Marinobacter sp. M2C]UQG69261.1 TRAP transporter substrate-binding protein [Marinobacter sp. M1C]
MSIKQKLSSLSYGVAVAAVISGSLVSSQALAAEKVRWQVPLAFPSHLIGLTTPVKYLSETLKEVTSGDVQLRYYEPGELVPPFEIMDAVSNGKYPAGYTWVGYDQGTIPALPLYSGAPFNMEPPAYLAWYYQGDGRELLEEIYAERNIHPMLCSIIGPEGAGWFAKPIESLEDFNGLKIRFAGIGGKVLEKLGASVTMVPGGEIYQALERKIIDASEFSQPAIDKMLGLDQVIKNYIMPGWHQTLTTSHLLVNMDTWKGLKPETRALIEMGCRSATLTGFAESEWAQPTALRDYQKEGVNAITLPEPVLRELQKVTNEVLDEIAAGDDMFNRVLTSQRNFMEHHSIWHNKGYLARDFYNYD